MTKVTATVSIVLIMIFADVLAGGKSVSGSQSGWSHAAQDQTANRLDGQVVSESPAPRGQKERAFRLAKNIRYNAHQDDLTKRSDDSFIEQIWPRALPIAPAGESAFIVVGTVLRMQPYLSEDRSRIYTELILQTDEVIKSLTDPVASFGLSPPIDLIGGALNTQSGQVVRDDIMIDGLGRTRVGGRYVLFAKKIHHGRDLTLIRGYELRDGRVFRLSDDGSAGNELVSSLPGVKDVPSEEGDFLRFVRKQAVESKHSH